jgi:hypothetical protein
MTSPPPEAVVGFVAATRVLAPWSLQRPLDEVSREHWLLQKSLWVVVIRVAPFGSNVPGLWCPRAILACGVRQGAGARGELGLEVMVWWTQRRAPGGTWAPAWAEADCTSSRIVCVCCMCFLCVCMFSVCTLCALSVCMCVLCL